MWCEFGANLVQHYMLFYQIEKSKINEPLRLECVHNVLVH